MAITSVLIPCLNGYDDLVRSIGSIYYTISRLPIVIVDDGSTLPISEKELSQTFTAYDFYILRNDISKGIEFSLNRGLQFIKDNLSQCQFVARLDAGDICINDRLHIQEKYLINNPNIHLVGSWVDYVNKEGDLEFKFRPDLRSKDVKKEIYFGNPFVHPAVMYRLDTILLLGGYPTEYPALEDYALFMRLVKNWDVSIIEKTLLIYEIDVNSISSTKRLIQSISKVRLILNNFYFGLAPILGIAKCLILVVLSRKITTKLKRVLDNSS